MENNIETRVVKPAVSFFENELNNLIISFQEESNLDSKIKDIEDYMKNNSGKGKTEQEKDELYQNAQNLWHGYSSALKTAKYNFHLNRPQHKFLTDLILTKMEYDVNTVFFAIELTDMIGGMKGAKYTDDRSLVSFDVNATEITYIYHLISKHKVKGLSKDAYTFSQILYRIGSISKIINFYDATHKNLSTDIQNWVLTFDEGVELDSTPVKKSKKEKEVTE
jgi:hypothetical protein